MDFLPRHGTLLSLKNKGIFLIGDSGLGKSETALQLIYQGAILICDDAPEFRVDDNKTIIGQCPKGFYGLMHLRDIGIINIINLLGPQHFKTEHAIDLIIELSRPDKLEQQNSRLTPVYKQWYFDDRQYHSDNSTNHQSIPGLCIHSSAKRNIALLIEIALRQLLFSQQDSSVT